MLKRVLFRIPFDANVVYGLFGEVLEELCAEAVGDGVVEVVCAQGLGEDVDGVRVLDFSVFEILLELASGEDAVFGYVGAVAVGGL